MHTHPNVSMLNKISQFLPSNSVLGDRFVNISIVECGNGFYVDDYVRRLKTTHDVVVLNFFDHYIYDDLTNSNAVNQSLDIIIHVCNLFKNKKILLLTENFYSERDLGDNKPNNLEIVVSPTFMYREYDEHISVTIPKKIFTTTTHVLCLNNNPRPHRVGILLYINYLNLESNIKSTFISRERWLSGVEYDYRTILSYIYTYSKLHNELNNIDLKEIYKNDAENVYPSNIALSDADNFIEKLSLYYSNSVIAIITESTGIEPTATLTEKFVHCIIGRCFPIIIGTYKNVELYRNMGYDMFDDIIDHSYDYEPNPFYRMKMAIDSNIEILTNKEFAVDLYYKNEHRLDANIENYKKQYNIILGDTIGNLDAELSKFGV